MGGRFLAGLRALNHSVIREVRGRGLLIALELNPDAGGARCLTEALMERGLLAWAGTSSELRALESVRMVAFNEAGRTVTCTGAVTVDTHGICNLSAAIWAAKASRSSG